MNPSATWGLAAVFCIAAAGVSSAGELPLPKHKLPPSRHGGTVVGLCDGETSVEVPGVKPGEGMSRAQAQTVADQLMSQWRNKHPDAQWAKANEGDKMVAREVQLADASGQPAANPSSATPLAPAQAQEQGQTYGSFTERDRQIWQASTDKLVAEGKRIFHDAKALGGTIGVSCDMCHPDAANTHPETYPKFQVQLGRVALLRDMINWCIENPVRGQPFADDDPRLKALEAYIIAQRKGVPLAYGKH
jgi:thiosulfate dehydrogenase